ncbi:helix-hairpin-helix domain-containing protein [Enterococcus sp. DIV0876]|uniref:helix-hairpin-helix domain-containing protein n=1 Tax=Enterococcus sp. DIV0876 TaxID=2774633 RepID=UPI003D2FF373
MREIIVILKEHWRIASIFIVVTVAIGGFLFSRRQTEPFVLAETAIISETVASESFESRPREIIVDIKGEVRIPGIYHLLEGARLYELIQKAGGLTEEALETAINLAQILQDQQMVVIPHQDDAVTLDIAIEEGIDQVGSANEQIDLNQADLAQLQTLPGIGVKKAEAIIQYREEHGFFKSIDELTKVSGIGDKTFDSLKEMIIVR